MPLVTNETGLRFGVIAGRVPPAPLSATLIVKGAFEVRPDALASTVPEDLQPHLDGDSPWDGDPGRGLRTPSDFAYYKPGTDLLLVGHCHTPGGRPAPVAQVTFRVGEYRKAAVVFGDRVLNRTLSGFTASEPVPFTQMPLDWSRAYGGPGFPSNPVGRGYGEVTLANGTRVRLAPNVELAERAMLFTEGHVEPIGFGPVDPNWPQRSRKVGTYDAAWLAQRWPGFPNDFDWTYFSAAPADQYLHRVFLTGEEELEFVNVDPEYPNLRSVLPGLRVRCFVRERKGEQLEFREVPMRIDTLLADMDARQVILTWRGVTAARSPKLKELEEYFVVVEPLRQPLGTSVAEYEALYDRRREEIQREFEVPPVVLDQPDMPQFEPPSLDWVPSFDQAISAARSLDMPAAAPLPLVRGPSGAPIPAAVIPDVPVPQSFGDAMRMMQADWATVGAQDPDFVRMYPPPDFSDLERDAAELAAFTGLPEEAEEPDEEPWTREKVLRHAASGGHFDNQDLSGLDLSELVFPGVRFIEANLESTNLSRVDFAGADLTRASLRDALVEEARFDNAVLEETDLAEIAGRGATFVGARLDAADFSGAKLPEARFVRADAPRASFTACDLAQANFESAILDGADFAAAMLGSARFVGASLTAADLDGAKAPGATFERASAFNLRASQAVLEGACFRHCVADEAVFEESMLADADFRGARLRLATLTGSNLTRTVFIVADLCRAKLDDVQARDARFVGVNLFRGSLEAAALDGATFFDCNLYEVEVYNASLVTTRFELTNLKGTKLDR